MEHPLIFWSGQRADGLVNFLAPVSQQTKQSRGAGPLQHRIHLSLGQDVQKLDLQTGLVFKAG